VAQRSITQIVGAVNSAGARVIDRLGPSRHPDTLVEVQARMARPDPTHAGPGRWSGR